MTTADEIRAQIAAERERLRQAQQSEEELKTQVTQAEERQRLRAELANLQSARTLQGLINVEKQRKIQKLDNDDEKADVGTSRSREPVFQGASRKTSSQELHTTFKDGIHTGSFVWKIEGMSWLRHGLTHYQAVNDRAYAESNGSYELGEYDAFDFVYHPDRGAVETHDDDKKLFAASLAIRPIEQTSSTFRYRISVQRSDGQFVQWGPQGDVYREPHEKTEMIFGPDVQPMPGPAAGIFGLTHDALLQSEWVHNDTLTVKFDFDLRVCNYDPHDLPIKNNTSIEVPPPSLASSFLSLLEEGKCSDVKFLVKGEMLKAHSQVLIARCEVFEKQLLGGMSEAAFKEVVIEDCEPDAFKAFLQYLYSDDMSHMDVRMKEYEAKSNGTVGGSVVADSGAASPLVSKVAFLQDVFSVSHKYQVTRLSRWCQQQLRDLICEANVCALLIQAYLCEARLLEEACLTYAMNNMMAIAKSPNFAHLASQWPELMMKITLCCSGASSSAAADTAAEHQNLLRKRKHE